MTITTANIAFVLSPMSRRSSWATVANIVAIASPVGVVGSTGASGGRLRRADSPIRPRRGHV
jgi:hypothetical protein